ncbi:putative proteasome, subunit alpha/beta, nucleophile aminohydrolase [Rosa chinensis]|uniref:Putative proteasome, subunit alpha/beta, nucleophile aminohydrolase n=1 Tax=Rosa chinensis TaxID=74649 RepID=A0A2P6Q4W0_ROSCH|nr:uncharacterized protein LOC121048978 [Rosa chinensis]PRQ29217.1 putative proteasome, subunit alpha/beta, nucleophile aminohydrolase [Rosa chinensis]
MAEPAEPHQGKKNSSLFQDEPIGDKMDFTCDPGTKRQAKVLDSIFDTGSKGLIGTTIIAVVGKKGTFIASDGKTSCNNENTKGLVLSWDYPKIVSITEYIMATISGGVIESERMIETVTKEVEQLSSKVDMKVVRKRFQKYMDIWKKKKKDENRNEELFPGLVLVYGYRKGKAYIYSVAADEYLESDTGVFGSGTGYKKAKEYIEEKLKNHNGEPTTNDYIEWLNTAVAVAALRDPLSGGYVNLAIVWKSKKKMKKMKKRGGHITRGDHVLQILGRDFDKLERYMEKVFMVVTYGMSYSLFNELQFKKAIPDNMEGVETAHLLAVGECSAENPDTIITRVVVFDSADARSSSQFQPGDEVLVFSDDNYDCELFMPTSDRIANLCNFLPSVE